MAYALLTLIKGNIEILPSNNSLDSVLTPYITEADAYIDVLLGNGTPLSTVPAIVRAAASLYAAGRYLARVGDNNTKSKDLIAEAEKQIAMYLKTVGRVTVFG